YAIERISFFAPLAAAGSRLLCRGEMQRPDVQTIVGAFDLIDADGAVAARVEGWTDRCFTVPDALCALRLDPAGGFLGRPVVLPGADASCAHRLDAFADPFFTSGGGLWQDMLALMMLSPAERAQFQTLPAAGPRRSDWLAGRIAAKEA